MSIFSELPDNRTDTQKKADRIIRSIVGFRKMTLLRFQQIAKEVWGDDDPIALIEAMGTNAAEVFGMSSQLAALLGIGQVIPDGYEATINEDGTVTVVSLDLSSSESSVSEGE